MRGGTSAAMMEARKTSWRSGTSGDLLADRLFNYAQELLAAGDGHAATDLFGQLVERTPGWAPAWFGLGKAKLLSAAEEPTRESTLRRQAAEAFERVLEVDPDDHLGAAIELSLLGSTTGGQAISPAFVKTMFDGYAVRFETHLTATLAYVGPALLRAAVADVCRARGRPFRFERVVDLGCGTGLAAEAFASLGGSFVGVDLSAEMIARARSKNVYTDLFVGSLLHWMQAQPLACADLVIAADVFVYFGDLGPVLCAVAALLAEDGLAGFTVQLASRAPYAIGADLRYAHARSYVAEACAAAGLRIHAVEPSPARAERGVPVPGLVVVVGRP